MSQPLAPEDGTQETKEEAVTNKSSWITHGSLFKAMWRLALPMIGGSILEDTYNLVDMYWVGRLGDAAIAGVFVSGIVTGTAAIFAFGVSIGCFALIARYIGAGRREEAGRVAAQAMLLAVGLAIATALGCGVFAEPLLRMLGANEDVLVQGAQFLRITALGSLVSYLGFVTNSSMRASGDAVTPLVATGVANVINCGLDPVLIFGWLGAPKLGVAGSAISTVIAQSVALGIVLYVFFIRGHQHFHMHLRDMRPDWEIMGRLLRVGVFGSGQAFVRNISAMAVIRIVSMHGGKTAQASFGIVMRVWFALLMVGMGFGMSAATLVGQNLGAGNPRRAARGAWMTSGVFTALSAIVAAVFVIDPSLIVARFSSDSEVIKTAGTFMRLMGLTVPFMCMSVVLGRALNGAGDTLWPMMITAISMLGVRIPVAWLLATFMGSVNGAWVAFAASNVLQGSMFIGWFASGRWKRKRI
jgi:putative MATE family efflux protein